MMYHIPFAVRFWGLKSFPGFTGLLDGRYNGFPILWRVLLGPGLISGFPRLFILPNIAALSLLVIVSKRYLKLSPALSICCCFTFPVAILVFRSSVQDFFVNGLLLTAAILFLAAPIVSLTTPERHKLGFSLLNNRDILGLACLAFAANVKYQGLMGSCIIFAAWLFFRYKDLRGASQQLQLITSKRRVAISFLLVVLIWAQPIVNTLVRGNPLYPVQIAGLPGTEPPTSSPIQYIPRIPLITNAASYFMSVTEIDPLIRSKEGWSFKRSWHNHNHAKGEFMPGPNDYKIYTLTGGSNGLLIITLMVLSWASLMEGAKNHEMKTSPLFKLRFRLLIASLCFMILPQSMELRYYMMTLFAPAMVAVSGDVNRWRQPSRYLVVIGVWFSLISPFLVPVYFWLRTGSWISADGLLSPDVYRNLPSVRDCSLKVKSWGGPIKKTYPLTTMDAIEALGCHYRFTLK